MMLKKFVEGQNVTYVVPLDKSIEDYPLFMDATRSIEDAIRRDLKNGYQAEYGPHYGIECLRVNDYVGYVVDKINRDNLYRFDTKSYRFFLGSVPVRNSLPDANPDQLPRLAGSVEMCRDFGVEDPMGSETVADEKFG